MEPTAHKVEAICVPGKDGIFAVFDNPNRWNSVGFAAGDDGHWILIDSFHKNWLASIIKALEIYAQS